MVKKFQEFICCFKERDTNTSESVFKNSPCASVNDTVRMHGDIFTQIFPEEVSRFA